MSGVIERADSIIGSSIIAVGSTSTTLAGANLNRRSLIIQNVGTVPVFLNFGTGATTSNYSVILAAGTAANDGTGGVWAEDVLTLTMAITAVVTTGTNNVVVTEI